MLRSVPFLPCLALLALLSACQGADGSSLSGPASAEVFTSAEAEEIRELIRALFPEPGLENAALKQFGNVERQLGRGETEDAIGKTFDLILFALGHYQNGRLEDPAGPLTKEETLVELLNALLAYVGLTPIFPEEGLGNEDFAVEICEAGESCLVVTGTKFAGLRATFLQRTLVTISRLPDDPGPFEPFGFDDFPLFYDIQVTSPAEILGDVGLAMASEAPVAPGAVAGVCVVDPPDPFAPPEEVLPDLRLAHVIEGAEGPEVEILPLADPDFLDCTEAATETPPVEITSLGWWSDRTLRAMEPVSEFLVAPVWAAPGRLGGTISALSPFGAVDQTSGDDEPEGGPTRTRLLLNGTAANLIISQGQIAAATAVVEPAPGNSLQPTVSYFWPTFPGGTTPTAMRSLDDGEATLEFVCDTNGTVTPGPGVVEIGSGSRFVRAAFPGAGPFEGSSSGSLVLGCVGD